MKKIIFICLTIITVIAIYLSINQKDLKQKTKSKENNYNNELFEKYYKKAKQKVSKMSLKEKIGQLFLVRYDDYQVENQIKNYHPGGYILFAKDFKDETKESIKNKINKLQQKSSIPLTIGVDEEGGTVVRVSKFKNFRNEAFLSPKDVYDQGGFDLLEQTEKEKAQLLLSLGINFNLAPVADVSTNENDFIYDRSFRSDAKTTADYISKMVEYANDSKISSCLKHFPGYGNNEDTHTGISIDKRDYDSFENSDFLPFKSGISKKVPVILVSHNVVLSMDPKYPASLSYKVHQILRKKLNFSGIIITDDLNMGAINKYVENNEAATLAIKSGNDMIITSDFEKMYNEVLNNVENDNIDIKDINNSLIKIISWKYAYGLIKK